MPMCAGRERERRRKLRVSRSRNVRRPRARIERATRAHRPAPRQAARLQIKVEVEVEVSLNSPRIPEIILVQYYQYKYWYEQVLLHAARHHPGVSSGIPKKKKKSEETKLPFRGSRFFDDSSRAITPRHAAHAKQTHIMQVGDRSRPRPCAFHSCSISANLRASRSMRRAHTFVPERRHGAQA